MKIFINQSPRELPDGATLADAISDLASTPALAPRPPFAAAVNLQFVPNTQYATRQLAEGDRVEIISPVTGG